MIVISSFSNLYASTSRHVPAGLAHTVGSAFLSRGAFMDAWRAEFVGTLLMVFLTFSPGKWIGVDSWIYEWSVHCCGVILADYIGGGPHVNPAVSFAMFCLGKVSYSEFYVRVMGAMAGGLVAFPLFKVFSDAMSWTALGGPEYSIKDEDDDGSSAFLNEFMSMFLLVLSIFVLNFELNFGAYHYIIKQTLQALFIRYLIVVFGLTGPAMNPMLGTAWATFSSGGAYPTQNEHYYIYWIAPFLAAGLASFVYVIYAGGEFIGNKIPLGPVKSVKPAVAGQQAEKKKKTTKKE